MNFYVGLTVNFIAKYYVNLNMGGKRFLTKKIGLLAPLISFALSIGFTCAQAQQNASASPPTAASNATNKTKKKKKTLKSKKALNSKAASNVKSSATPSKTPEAPTIEANKDLKIQIPDHLKNKGKKLRIRNLKTGREAILTIGDEEFISSEVVRSLMDSQSKTLVPEFSLVDAVKASGKINAPSDPSLSGFRMNKERFTYVQPIWKPVPFAMQNLPGGGMKIYIDTKQSAVPLNPALVEGRRDLKEDPGIKKLFDAGFKALNAHRYDISLDAFGRILQKKENLSETQIRQASLGHGISSFHQLGCAQVETDFKVAELDPKNFDDVSYYRALCFVEAKKFEAAGGLFRDLAKRQSPVYGEQARFYIGVVAENEEKYDEAEAAYMDTIDFANDARIVALAKQRVDLVRKLKAERDYQNKWFTLGLSTGVGYDTNVTSLPAGVDPSAFNLTGVKSVSYLGVGSLEIKPRITKRIDNRYRYTFVMMHYQDSAIAASSDVQSHDGAIILDYSLNASNSAGITADYNSVFLGPMQTSSEYMATASGEFHWAHLHGDPVSPFGDTALSLKYGYAKPRAPAASAETDSTANSYLMSYRYTSRKSLPSIWGPGFDLEYRPAKGVDNSYISLNLIGTYSRPVGSETLGLMMSHEASLQDSNYYQRSAGKRNDFILKYTGGLSRVWWQKVETKLQFVGTMSYSNVSTNTYRKLQLNLLVSTSF